MVFLLRIAVMFTVLLAVLANLGVNITAFVASLGIGGIAVAFALQAILSDLFASLSIGLDKPFEVGDFIVVDDLLGTVEYVGIRTTLAQPERRATGALEYRVTEIADTQLQAHVGTQGVIQLRYHA